jgi:hypothetical protein
MVFYSKIEDNFQKQTEPQSYIYSPNGILLNIPVKHSKANQEKEIPVDSDVLAETTLQVTRDSSMRISFFEFLKTTSVFFEKKQNSYWT